MECTSVSRRFRPSSRRLFSSRSAEMSPELLRGAHRSDVLVQLVDKGLQRLQQAVHLLLQHRLPIDGSGVVDCG
ncbi:hypothetical protein TYRP_017472 [Tyrophagus putrescentiae]|nr:hypothetical protein TYRP_017472 [Tyrophagus putrescentiae]